VIIDVRGPDEFAGPLGHIPGALNIPVDSLLSRLEQVKAAHGRQIVLVCKTDKRSAKAAATLREAGVGGATVLQGGMEAWNNRNTAPG
jgi:rhodanese-related sulfurtransferase